MSKILPILGLIVRIFAILLLIGVILGVGYSTYYFAAPQSMPRPINMEGVSKTLLIWMLPMQRANPPALPQPTAPATAPAPTGTPSASTTGGPAGDVDLAFPVPVRARWLYRPRAVTSNIDWV
jgi:hypothetical protein